ncbi:MAG: TetR/AcrR family transcriptional regulator [Myxococcota bacterium]
MAERRRRRKEARPGELVEAGFAEFAAHGFARTRLEDVARRAGVSRPTIYRYFDDKEDLFRATLQSKLPAAVGEVETMIDAYPGTTQSLLELLIDRMYDEQRRGDIAVIIRIIMSEGPQFPALVELYHREALSRFRRLLGRVLERGIARGEVRADLEPLLPMMVVSPAVMALLWQTTFAGVEPLALEDFRRAHLQLLFGRPFLK